MKAPEVFHGKLVIFMILAIIAHGVLFGWLLEREKEARFEAEEQLKLWEQSVMDCHMQLMLAEEGCRE